ncbi:MAG: acetylornithine deacetylase/succinyl-diaminopimelate desuccinylase-like protein [Desulforhopalus sp.]|jgi:acetylornithine deacetylase/succinyl-diaminopimelate desuccinylase-like protein
MNEAYCFFEPSGQYIYCPEDSKTYNELDRTFYESIKGTSKIMDYTAQLTEYLQANLSTFTEDLIDWLKIPSISTLPEHKQDVHHAAQWIQSKLGETGFDKPELIETDGHPLVYAHWLVDPAQPTLLIYGHYDVQPADPLELWDNPPFEPVIKDGNLYARGASDDKGQIMLVMAALKAWVATAGKPPINIKILFEGEEEAGGASIAAYVVDNKEKLSADGVLICDTHMPSASQPSLITGLRGILYTELKVTGAKTDLHSGSYGGVAPNPIHALCLMISQLKTEDGTIQIPELQDRMPTPTPAEKIFFTEDPLDIESALCDEMGISELVGESNFPPLERLGLRPTFEVHGIAGGFTGAGAKTVIPAEATAKISLRVPPTFDTDEVFSWLSNSIDRVTPKGYQVQLTNIHAGSGIEVNQNNEFFAKAASSLETIYGKSPVFLKEGGSIPIAALFDQELHIPVVLMGFALPDDNIHAPNEKFNLQQFSLGMQTVAHYLGKLKITSNN